MFVKAENLRSSLHELEELLEKYSPLMSGSVEKFVGAGIKYGAIAAQVSSPAFTWKTNEQDIDTF